MGKNNEGEGWFLSGMNHSGWDGWKDKWLRHGIFQLLAINNGGKCEGWIVWEMLPTPSIGNREQLMKALRWGD